jgi:hypothetical protein
MCDPFQFGLGTGELPVQTLKALSVAGKLFANGDVSLESVNFATQQTVPEARKGQNLGLGKKKERKAPSPEKSDLR